MSERAHKGFGPTVLAMVLALAACAPNSEVSE